MDQNDLSEYNLEEVDLEQFGYEQVIDGNDDNFILSRPCSVKIKPGRNFSKILSRLNWSSITSLSVSGNYLRENDLDEIGSHMDNLKILEYVYI